MRIHIIAGLCAAVAAHGVFAVEGGDEAKKQEVFGKMKEVKLAGIRGRVEILQQAASCVQGAQNNDAARACDERERQANEDLMRRQKDRWESLKPR